NGSDFGFYWKEEELTEAAKSSRKGSSRVNIEALVLHEMGHVLGLKHKDGDSSVMATYLAGGDDRVNVAATDKKALQCEY
ncbi:MAG: matrixin family metalloprotease, partial [Bdellovibrio sp.]